MEWQLPHDQALEVVAAAHELKACGIDAKRIVHGWSLEWKRRAKQPYSKTIAGDFTFQFGNGKKLYSVPQLERALSLADVFGNDTTDSAAQPENGGAEAQAEQPEEGEASGDDRHYRTRGIAAPGTYSAILASASHAEPSLGAQAVGRRLKIKWTNPPQWFKGTVMEFDATGLHLVKYDDGDQRRHNLKQEINVGQLEWETPLELPGGAHSGGATNRCEGGKGSTQRRGSSGGGRAESSVAALKRSEPGQYACATCGRAFGNAGALTSHTGSRKCLEKNQRAAVHLTAAMEDRAASVGIAQLSPPAAGMVGGGPVNSSSVKIEEEDTAGQPTVEDLPPPAAATMAPMVANTPAAVCAAAVSAAAVELTSQEAEAVLNLRVGDALTAMDRVGMWGDARVVAVRGGAGGAASSSSSSALLPESSREYKVHFLGWNSRYDEWISTGLGRLRPKPTQPPPSAVDAIPASAAEQAVVRHRSFNLNNSDDSSDDDDDDDDVEDEASPASLAPATAAIQSQAGSQPGGQHMVQPTSGQGEDEDEIVEAVDEGDADAGSDDAESAARQEPQGQLQGEDAPHSGIAAPVASSESTVMEVEVEAAIAEQAGPPQPEGAAAAVEADDDEAYLIPATEVHVISSSPSPATFQGEAQLHLRGAAAASAAARAARLAGQYEGPLGKRSYINASAELKRLAVWHGRSAGAGTSAGAGDGHTTARMEEGVAADAPAARASEDSQCLSLPSPLVPCPAPSESPAGPSMSLPAAPPPTADELSEPPLPPPPPPPVSWRCPAVGDAIEVEVQPDATQPGLTCWATARVTATSETAAIPMGTFSALLTLPPEHGSDQWEDMYTWEEERVDWRRSGAEEGSGTGNGSVDRPRHGAARGRRPSQRRSLWLQAPDGLLPPDEVDRMLWPGASEQGWRAEKHVGKQCYSYVSPAGVCFSSRAAARGSAERTWSKNLEQREAEAKAAAVEAARRTGSGRQVQAPARLDPSFVPSQLSSFPRLPKPDRIFKIEKIVEERRAEKFKPETHKKYEGFEFRIRWKGFSPADDTWEPFKNIHDGAQVWALALVATPSPQQFPHALPSAAHPLTPTYGPSLRLAPSECSAR